MSIEYVVIREAGDMVTWLIVDDTDFVEVHRITDPCPMGGDVARCLEGIVESQTAAEEFAGGLLPWVVSDNDADPRVCYTTKLVHLPMPDMIE